jgi:hypothetical protein
MLRSRYGRFQVSGINNQQSAINNQQSTISNQQSAINNQQSAISNLQSGSLARPLPSTPSHFSTHSISLFAGLLVPQVLTALHVWGN